MCDGNIRGNGTDGFNDVKQIYEGFRAVSMGRYRGPYYNAE